MSLVPRSLHKLRIIAVPLTHTKPPSHHRADSKYDLTFYQFQLSSPKQTTTTDKAGVKSRWLPEEGVARFLQSKTARIWTEFGKSRKGSWKACVSLCFFFLFLIDKFLQLKVFETGERLMDRIEFGELSLKGLDPSLGPSVVHASNTEKKLQVCMCLLLLHVCSLNVPPLWLPRYR